MGGIAMKTNFIYILLAIVLFSACSSLKETSVNEYDDLYYNPRQDKLAKAEAELQEKEAEWFFVHEGKIYEDEAKKHGYKTFRNSIKAEEELIRILK